MPATPHDGPVKRSVRVAGHATSVSLEPAFWEELRRIAAEEGVSLASLVSGIDASRTGNLSSALRLFVLERLKVERAT
ncbi:MAG: ribbon-helix-helix domain-containing protein [Rhodothalassiaceae bacterium]